MQAIRVVFLFLVSIFLCACTKGVAAPTSGAPSPITPLDAPLPTTPTVVIKKVPTEAVLEEGAADPRGQGEAAQDAINPLTGEVVDDASLLQRRPMLIKVSNFPRNNRPQWGLSHADIVFEHYAEGGLTRFSALFYGQDAATVGPIRSARFIDIELVNMYGAIFAYGSADFRVREGIAESAFANRTVTEYPARCPPMCRFDPVNYNHLITSTIDLQTYVLAHGMDNTPPDLGGLVFSAEAPGSGEPGEVLEIRYSVGNFHRWEYDDARGAYLRSQETGADDVEVVPLTDALDGEGIGAENVLVVIAPHTFLSDTSGLVEIHLDGAGSGLAFRDGYVYEVEWQRDLVGGLRFTTPGGGPFALKPGSTWIEFVSTSSEIHEPDAGEWAIRFHIP
ncbi:MAG: DUF3048 domain-containing protein [Anaerolineales bacterium]|nr:DUF3048 domain-containing protein [Anaerolineales bacterium]